MYSHRRDKVMNVREMIDSKMEVKMMINIIQYPATYHDD